MVKDFVDIWNDHKGEILSKYEENGTPSYNHSTVKIWSSFFTTTPKTTESRIQIGLS